MEVFSDEAMAAVVPIAVYWLYSGLYMALVQSMDRYRLHPKEHEDTKNMVSKAVVVKTVLLQQLVQLLSVVLVTTLRGLSTATGAGGSERTSYLTVARSCSMAGSTCGTGADTPAATFTGTSTPGTTVSSFPILSVFCTVILSRVSLRIL